MNIFTYLVRKILFFFGTKKRIFTLFPGINKELIQEMNFYFVPLRLEKTLECKKNERKYVEIMYTFLLI
jgi:hypothetical protein